jgi:hypothetical protein
MPASGSPNATLATPVHRLIAHPGTGDRHQSERLLAFSRNDCSASAGARSHPVETRANSLQRLKTGKHFGAPRTSGTPLMKR